MICEELYSSQIWSLWTNGWKKVINSSACILEYALEVLCRTTDMSSTAYSQTTSEDWDSQEQQNWHTGMVSYECVFLPSFRQTLCQDRFSFWEPVEILFWFNDMQRLIWIYGASFILKGNKMPAAHPHFWTDSTLIWLLLSCFTLHSLICQCLRMNEGWCCCWGDY